MSKTKEVKQEKTESIFQKEKRLKKRKFVYKETYRKGLFLSNNQTAIDWLNQPDVLVRIQASGTLDDGTMFASITIEGFNEGK